MTFNFGATVILAKEKLKLTTRNVNENVGVLHQLLYPLLAWFVVLLLLYSISSNLFIGTVRQAWGSFKEYITSVVLVYRQPCSKLRTVLPNFTFYLSFLSTLPTFTKTSLLSITSYLHFQVSPPTITSFPSSLPIFSQYDAQKKKNNKSC